MLSKKILSLSLAVSLAFGLSLSVSAAGGHNNDVAANLNQTVISEQDVNDFLSEPAMPCFFYTELMMVKVLSDVQEQCKQRILSCLALFKYEYNNNIELRKMINIAVITKDFNDMYLSNRDFKEAYEKLWGGNASDSSKHMSMLPDSSDRVRRVWGWSKH